MDLSDVTIAIKTFERPQSLKRLVQSIRCFYPSMPIVIADDSETPRPGTVQGLSPVEYWCLPFDLGVSCGRNLLAGGIGSQYVLMLEDDVEVTEESRIETLMEGVLWNDFDVVGSAPKDPNGREQHLEAHLLRAGHTIQVQPVQTETPTAVDFTDNCFLARTDTLRAVRWDDQQKTVDHLDFFLRCQQKGVRVGYVPGFHLLHHSDRSSRYNRFRVERSGYYQQRLLDQWGLTSIEGRIHISGLT